ncbi:MAG: hypothetical protein MJZ21_00965 [archaeon]|nr:hypothetical protein [archaeon]
MKVPDKKWLRLTYLDDSGESALADISRPVVNKFLEHVMLIIAVIMIVYGFVTAYVIIVYQTDDDWVSALNFVISFIGGSGVDPVEIPRLFRVPPSVLYVICGVLIFMDCRRNFIKSVGLYAACVGFNKIVSAVPFIISKTEVTFLTGLVIFVLGANVTYSGYRMLSGTVRGRNGMLATAILLLVVYLEYIAMMMYINVNAYSVPASEVLIVVMKSYPTMFVSCVMYCVLIWLLGTSQIRYGDELYRHIDILKEIDNTYRAEKLVIEEKDLGPLLDPASPDWCDPDDGGPVEKEFKFVSDGVYGRTRIFIQKWKGEEKLHFTLIGTPEGSFVYANRMDVAKIVPDSTDAETCNHVALLRTDGQILTLSVNHPPKKDEMLSEMIS